MNLLFVPEAAAAASVSESTIRIKIKQGKLSRYMRGGRVQVARDEVRLLFSPQKTSPGRNQAQCRIIAVANQKGGAAKTTTVSALATLLGQSGARVLVIDADPQGNLTQSFGLNPDDQDLTLYSVLVEDVPILSVIQNLSPRVPNVSIVPANLDLTDTWRQVAGRVGLDALLKTALFSCQVDYEVIMIDCAPSLDMSTINALVAATDVIIPVNMSAFSMRGMGKLRSTMQEVRKVNPGLPQPHIVCCCTDNTAISKAIELSLRRNSENSVFRTSIPRAKDVAEAPFSGKPLPMFAPRSKVTLAYAALAEEVRNA